jgi:sn-glycerol 3-phosphate transport system permease protein
MSPISLVPGSHILENYAQVLGSGTTRTAVAPVGRMMWVSLVSALAIAIGKIAISMLSAFALVYFPLPGRAACSSG